MAAALPSVTLTVPTEVMIGSDFSFTATFDSSGTTGYGPFIDLIFPATGADGNDGITFTSATYLGQAITAVQLTFPSSGCVDHPYAKDTNHDPLIVCGTPGDTLVVLQLPFGSFTAGQPPLDVTVNATLSNLADLGTALAIHARSGYEYGNDALNNPCCDPSITNPSSTNSLSWPSSPVTPKLIDLVKTYLGPEDETATGPNFPQDYRIDVDIAPGQTITNLDVTDLLPNNMAFLSVVSSSPSGATLISTPTVGAAANSPNNDLTVRFPSVTGTTAISDASVTLRFFVPLDDADGNPVIAATDGNDVLSQNNASVQGTWVPLDSRDPSSPGNAVVDGVGPEHTLTDKSLAIQKGVAIVNDVGATGYSVGDTLEYTIQYQISDYFAFQNLTVDDTLSDGQRYDPSFPPTLSVNGNSFTLPAAAINSSNLTITPNYTPASPAPNDGSTAMQFRVSDELVTRGQANGSWIGGCVPVAGTGGPAPDCTVYNDGGTTATITFRTIIQDQFSDTFPSGDPYVNSGDHLDNNVTISGDLLSVADTSIATGYSETDTSATQIKIVFGELSKSIYAINGNTAYATPVTVEPGDTVTYRLQYDLASSDFENLQFVDNLPLPIFDAAELATFDSAYDAGGTAPVAGHYKLGPSDTYHARPSAVSPTLSTNTTDNSATFSYGTFNDPANQASAIDILFTMTVTDQPFADKLFLTNQAHESDGSTNGPQHTADAIVQVQVSEPALQIKKGVIGSDSSSATLSPATAGPVSFSAPGSSGTRWTGTINSTNLTTDSIDSDISGVDSGDLVSFAIVVENTGSSGKGAFDLTITDTLPLGLVIPSSGAGLNLRVTYGDGTPLSYVGLTNGAGAAQDLFTSGIQLDDPALVGACQKYDPTNGHNIIIITYDLQIDSTAPAGTIIPNHAAITNYASSEGGPNFVPQDHPTDSATTTIASPGIAKQLTGTELTSASNSNTQAVIGEIATYTLVITVPEGVTNNAIITDTLDSGLAFVDVTSVTPSASVSMSTPIGVGASPANTVVGSGGTSIVFKPGTLTNSNTNNAQAETLTIVYRAVVLDVAGNQAGTQLNNSAKLTWAEGALTTVSAANVTVVEPALTVTKTASPTSGDAGDTVTFDLTVSNPSSGSTNALDVSLSDVIPTGMTYVSGSLTNISGPVATLNAASAPSLSAAWASLAPGSSSVIRFQVTLDASVTPGQTITNNASVQWTSLTGTPGQRSTYNTSSTERTGAGGVDDYTTSDSEAVTVNSLVLTKSLVTTSEAHTSGNNVAIGEIVRYRLAVQLPEGSLPNIQINDNLPAGLTFLNDGTARIAFVSNDGGISSASAQSGAIPAIVCTNDTGSAADLATLPQVSVDCTLADANISTSAASNADTYSSGTDVRFKLGTLSNADSDADSEFVVIEFNALVDNSVAGSNDAGDTRTNTFNVFLNGTTANGPTSGGATVTVVEPSIPFNSTVNNKTVFPTTGDAGDVVTYTLVYTNASGANNTTAFNAQVLDMVPPEATLNLGSISVTATAVCASPTFTNASAGNSIDITLSRVEPGCTITITYQATLKTTVTPGQLINNTANLTYTSLPGINGTTSNSTGSSTPGTPGTDTGERNGSGTAPNDYLGSDVAQVTVFVPAPQKSLVSTSEASTSGSSLAIGEIARYRMVVRISEGSSPSFQLRDSLPAGLTYLNDGTTKIALISSDPGLSSDTISGSGLQVIGNESSESGITPSFVLPSSAISGGSGAGGAFQNGDDPIFSLGSLSNTDNDSDQELVVVEFNALTGNVAGNQSGTTLANTFDVLVNSSLIATSNSVTTTVAEASITDLSKTVTTTPSDAGDTVVYQITYSNGATGASRATAFNVVLTDTLNSNLNLQSVSVTTPSGSSATDTSTLGVGGVVRIAVDQLPPSVDISGVIKNITITVTARVINTAANGQIIPNTSDLTYTSLPGAKGTTSNATGSSTPGGSGTPTGERDGSGGVNDYTDSSNVSVTLATPTVQKLAPAPTTYTIGETVTYDIRVSLPEGATPALTVTDSLPSGLGYVSHSVVTTSAASNGHLSADYNGTLGAPTFANSSGVLTFDFGAVQTNGSGPSNGTSANQFLVRVVTKVLNVAGNQDGSTLINSASLTYKNPNTGSNVNVSGGTQTISLVEPLLTIVKSVSTPSANVGDVITFQIQISNTSTIAAHDVVITDTVPSGLSYMPGTIAIGSGPSGTTDDSSAPALAWNFPTIPAGGTAVVTFDARVTGSGPLTIGNLAGVTWTSTSGSNPDERTGAGGAINDYNDTATATLQTASYELDKRLVSPASGLAGVNDTVRFSITVTNTGATALATIPLTDTFDSALLQFLSANVTPDSSTAGQITWNNVGPLAVGANKTILIDFKTLATTDAQPGKVTINRTGVSGAEDSNGTMLPTQTSSASVAIGTPDLRVTITDGRSSTTPGDTLTYTIQVTNTGSYTATGVVITETVPLNTSFAGGSVPWVAQGGGVYTYTLPAPLGPGQSTTVTFVVTVDSSVPAGTTTISDTVSVDNDGSHGADATPANNTATDVDTLAAAPDLAITKSDGGASVTPGSTVTYTLSYTNTGNQDATGVIITETVPLHSSFDAGASTSGWVCTPDSSAGSTCTLAVGNLASGASGSVTFAVTLVAPAPVGVTQLSNTTSIGDDGSNGTDSTPADNTSSDTTPIIAVPDLSINKTDGGISTTPGGVVTYTLTYTNAGNIGASGVVITETVPLNSSFNASASTSGWVCTPDSSAGSTCTFPVGTVAGGGASGSVTFAVTVDKPLPIGITQIANSASIGDDGSNGADSTPADNTSSDTTPISAAPDMVITKSDGGISTTPGSTVTYTLSYTNAGNIGASGVMITETVPANSSFNAGASASGWVCTPDSSAGSTCTLAVGTVAGGASGSVTFAVTVDSPLPAGVTQLSNSTSIGDDGSNGADSTPADNTSSDTTPINAAPDLAISKSDGGISVAPGGIITYTLSYTNTGNQDATGVVVTETVPANSSFDTSAKSGWTCTPDGSAGSTCTFTVGDLAVGASGSTTFIITVDSLLPAGATQIDNTATIADDGSNGPEPTPANNTSSVSTPVDAAPDLQLLKSDGGASTSPGLGVAYTLSYTNTGNIGASGVVITETVPLHTSFDASSSTSGWVCTPNGSAGSTCTFPVGTLAGGGASGSVTFAVTVDKPLPAGVTQIANSASIGDNGSNGIDTTPANNTSSDTTPVRAAPDLRLSKRADISTIQPDAPIQYTLTYTNVGTIAATGVVITETVPLQTTFNASASLPTVWSCSNGAASGTTCTTNIAGSVAGNGGGGSVKFVVHVNDTLSSQTTQISNTATIGDDGKNGADLTPNNNVGSVSTPLHPTAIALTSFTAQRQGTSILVRWTTSAELNTWGFNIYRSSDGDRAHATRVTSTLILSTGRGQGASYVWEDLAPSDGSIYTYWLEEVETNGTTHEYGPATMTNTPSAAGHSIYIPLIYR